MVVRTRYLKDIQFQLAILIALDEMGVKADASRINTKLKILEVERRV